MHFPLSAPWAELLSLVFGLAMFYIGRRFELRRARLRRAAITARAQGSWDNWTEADIKQELRGTVSTETERYRTAKATSIDCGGMRVMLDAGDVFTVHRNSGAAPETKRVSTWFEERNAEVDKSIAQDPAGFYLAMTGQRPPSELNYTIVVACAKCRKPTPLEVHPTNGATNFELLEPEGWRVVFNNMGQKHAVFALECPNCRPRIDGVAVT